MSLFQKFREGWVRPALFFGNNPISLAGGAVTSASGVTMIGYWLVEMLGRPNDNPYLGIIFFLLLPAMFIGGLILIPVGVLLRRRTLQKAGQIPAEFPKIDLNDKMFRHGLGADISEPDFAFAGQWGFTRPWQVRVVRPFRVAQAIRLHRVRPFKLGR